MFSGALAPRRTRETTYARPEAALHLPRRVARSTCEVDVGELALDEAVEHDAAVDGLVGQDGAGVDVAGGDVEPGEGLADLLEALGADGLADVVADARADPQLVARAAAGAAGRGRAARSSVTGAAAAARLKAVLPSKRKLRTSTAGTAAMPAPPSGATGGSPVSAAAAAAGCVVCAVVTVDGQSRRPG